MVDTRSQKRNREDTQDICDDNLQVNDDYSNMNIVKRKKRNDHGGGNNQNSNMNQSLFLSDDEDDDVEWATTEQSEDEGTAEATDPDNEEDTEPENDEEGNDVDDKLTKMKFNQKQIHQIMKESIKTLVKKYDDEDMEFLPEGQADKHSEYDKFLDLIGDIHSGEFFERVPVEERKKRLKSTYTEDEMKQLNEELVSMKKMYKENAPSVIDILKMDIPIAQKQKLLEKMHHLVNSEILTGEYNASLKYLFTNINKTRDPEMFKLEQDIIKSAQADEYSDDYRQKILKSKMSFENKVIAYKRLEVMERYEESDSSEYAKYKNWMDLLLSVPFGNYIKTPSLEEMSGDDVSSFIKNVRVTLDKRLSFLEKPKDQVLNVVTSMIRNPHSRVNAIGLYGGPGLGKSSIVKSIAESLGRPYRAISLGGESDASVLSGHGFTYVGSTPGRIIEILSDTKAMNPVVLIDEADKISQPTTVKKSLVI
jgi:ATP-dependent Lon protease